jgi:cytochrome c biogenesis protein CcdA
VPAALLAAVVVMATVVGALAGGPTGGALGTWFAAVSGGLSARLSGVGAALPFGYAFAAGMVTAVNPCGFVLVPAYLGRYLSADGRTGRRRLLLRAVGFSGVVASGFVGLFAAAGLVVGALGAAVVPWLPWAGLVVGLLLVLAGALAVLGGPAPSFAVQEGVATRLGEAASRPGLPGYLAYGLAYGLASLGCALPIFLTIVGGAMTQGLAGAVGLFVLYGLGLGAVLSATALAATVLGTEVIGRAGPLRRFVPAAGATLLLLAGAYITYYWLTAGGLLARVVA